MDSVHWTHNGLDPHKLAEDQASDPGLTAATDSSLRLEQVQFDQHLRLWCDILQFHDLTYPQLGVGQPLTHYTRCRIPPFGPRVA